MSAREPFFPVRSEKATENAQSSNKIQNSTDPHTQASTRPTSAHDDNHRPLNVSGLIKSRSSKKKESNSNQMPKPHGSFDHVKRPIPPPKSKPILQAIAAAHNNRQTAHTNVSASASDLSGSISHSNQADALLKTASFFKPTSANATAEAQPVIASGRMQETQTPMMTPKPNSAAQPHFVSERTSTSAHIRLQTFGSPDPFHFQPAQDELPSDLEIASGFGFGLGLAAAADTRGSPRRLGGNQKNATDKRARDEDEDRGGERADDERTGRDAKRRKEAQTHDVDASPTFSPQHGHYYRDHEPPAMMLYGNGQGSGSLGENRSHQHPLPAYADRNHSRPSSPASTAARGFSDMPEPAAVPENDVQVIQDILGIDINAFALGKVEQYEANKKKWAECTPEEWLAGGQELAKMFTSLMDFTRDHMAAKMKLFQTLDGSIAAHTDVLKGRAEVLAEAKRSLIENGKTLA